MTKTPPRLSRQQRRKLEREARDETSPINESKLQTIVMPLGEALHKYGPMLKCRWARPANVEATFDPENAPHGWMLIDTGASRCVIDRRVVESLGLASHGSTDMSGSQGLHAHQLYRARVAIQVSPDGTVLHKELEVVSADVGAGYPLPVIGIIGRDVLRSARFRYEGVDNRFELDLDPAAFERSCFDPSTLALDRATPERGG